MRSFIKAATVFISHILLCTTSGDAQTPYQPANYPAGMPLNYVRTWDAMRPEKTSANVVTSIPTREFQQTTQYLDGLGRPLQAVARKMSLPTGYPLKDLVNAKVYDEYGREAYQFLPFASTGAAPQYDDGSFKIDPFAQQVYSLGNSFVLSPLIGQNESFLYSNTKFENAPSGRPVETFAPGSSWAGTASQPLEANRRSIKTKYAVNTAIDSVRIWTVNGGAIGTWATFSSPDAYAPGLLSKVITTDEHGKQVIEFKDKSGLVILKKVQIAANADDGTGRGHTGWLCTYYMYDNLGNLRCVLQPQGVKAISSNWLLVNTLIEQGFRYEYDQKNRLIMKRVPGNGVGQETYMVYDARDRLVMMQDANMRVTDRWMVTKYDSQNRPIETGLWINATGVATHRATASASTSYPTTSTNYEMLSVTHYDDYAGIPAGLTTTLDNTGSTQFHTVFNGSPLYAQQVAVSTQTSGMITWTQTKVLGTASDFISTVNLYDVKGRLIQSKIKNATGGTDISTTQYNWAGKPLITVLKTDLGGGSAQSFTVVKRTTYDDLQRPLTIEQKIAHSAINSGAFPAGWTMVSLIGYDAVGQLSKKNIGNKKNPATGTYYLPRQPLQSLVYDYNVRGWLLGMNRNLLKTEGQAAGDTLFAFELGYDKLTNRSGNDFAAAQYNGNIGGMTWKSDGDDRRRRYDFNYDAANRLLKAEFKQNNAGTTWDKTIVDYTVQMGNSGIDDGSAYDANGNILKMKQWGLKMTGSTRVDNLLYTYWNSGNMLKAVTDSGMSAVDHKLGDFTDKNATATDYGYDRNGNMVIDLNKRINGTVAANTGLASGGGITYNHLNLPSVITIRNDANTADKGTITYTYAADGTKLTKVAVENNVSITVSGTAYTTNITSTTRYLNGAVFESKQYSHATVNTALGYTDRLQFFPQEEGRVRAVYNPAAPNTVASLEYDYMIKDHLGNVRMVLTEELRTDAYPVASMETAQAATEESFYGGLSTRTDKPNGYPADTYTNPNEKVALVRGDGNKIGPSMLLKVMAGDTFHIRANAWWTGTSSGANTTPLTSIVTALINGATGVSGGKITAGDLNSTILDPQVTAFLATQPGVAGQPKAYLNWVLFDEQFKFVSSSSGSEAVDASGVFKTFNKTNMPVHKNGYLYIYVSNETSYDVFFDNLQVTHVRGRLLEEGHYYPFGLSMAGISSKALSFGGPENKEQTFQGQRFDDELGLNWVQFKWRNHDPQIGRFVEIDPLASEYAYNSTYAFSENKVTNHIELEGLESVPAGTPQGYLFEGFRQYFHAATSWFKFKASASASSSSKTSTKVGNVEKSTTVTTKEFKAELVINPGAAFEQGGGDALSASVDYNTNVRTEEKLSGTVKTPPVDVNASVKYTEDSKGEQKTTSVGFSQSAQVGPVKASYGGDVYYTEGTGGQYKGQQSTGTRMSADATYVYKREQIVDPAAKAVTVITSQLSIGVSAVMEIKLPRKAN